MTVIVTWSQDGEKFRRSSAVVLEAETTENTVNNANSKVCVEPYDLEIVLAIGLVSAVALPSGYDVTVTLTITNNTSGSLVIEPGTFDPSGITWDSPNVTVADGATETLTGVINTSTMGEYTVTGYVQSGDIESNTDSETVDTTGGVPL